MPTYLCHGFRWHRKSIRYFVVIQDLDDAAPEWIVASQSAVAFLHRFYELFDFLPPSNPPRSQGSLSGHNYTLSNGTHKHSHPPSAHQNHHRRFDTNERDDARVDRAWETWSNRIRDSASRSRSRSRPRKCSRNNIPAEKSSSPEPDAAFNDWSTVKLLEEYDPANLNQLNGPWAYVADHIVRVDTSASIAEEMMNYEERMKSEKVKAMTGPSDETGRNRNTSGNKKPGWFEMLRDQLQRGEDIKWYVVVCGDEERSTSPKDVGEDRGGVVGDSGFAPKNPLIDFDEEEFICRFPELLGKGDASRDKDWRRPKATDAAPPIVGDSSVGICMPGFSDFEVRPLSLRPPPARKTPPVVPTKDHPRRAPPIPTALQMQEMRKSSSIDDSPTPPKTPRTGSSGGLRRFFSKRNLHNPDPD